MLESAGSTTQKKETRRKENLAYWLASYNFVSQPSNKRWSNTQISLQRTSLESKTEAQKGPLKSPQKPWGLAGRSRWIYWIKCKADPPAKKLWELSNLAGWQAPRLLPGEQPPTTPTDSSSWKAESWWSKISQNIQGKYRTQLHIHFYGWWRLSSGVNRNVSLSSLLEEGFSDNHIFSSCLKRYFVSAPITIFADSIKETW